MLVYWRVYPKYILMISDIPMISLAAGLPRLARRPASCPAPCSSGGRSSELRGFCAKSWRVHHGFWLEKSAETSKNMRKLENTKVVLQKNIGKSIEKVMV